MAKNKNTMNTQNIPLSKLQCNEGQVEGLPRNPRFIKDERFEKLKKSLQDDPEMLELRELIVYPHGNKFVVIGGNMRLRAAKQLGFKDMPCKVLPEDTPIEKLKAYTIKDNNAFGNDDFDLLANEWDVEFLEECGFEFGTLYDSEAKGDAEAKAEEKDLSDNIELSYRLEITCVNETEQEQMFNELSERGFVCKILTL